MSIGSNFYDILMTYGKIKVYERLLLKLVVIDLSLHVDSVEWEFERETFLIIYVFE